MTDSSECAISWTPRTVLEMAFFLWLVISVPALIVGISNNGSSKCDNFTNYSIPLPAFWIGCQAEHIPDIGIAKWLGKPL